MLLACLLHRARVCMHTPILMSCLLLHAQDILCKQRPHGPLGKGWVWWDGFCSDSFCIICFRHNISRHAPAVGVTIPGVCAFVCFALLCLIGRVRPRALSPRVLYPNRRIICLEIACFPSAGVCAIVPVQACMPSPCFTLAARSCVCSCVGRCGRAPGFYLDFWVVRFPG
jgi:hypothetical protein